MYLCTFSLHELFCTLLQIHMDSNQVVKNIRAQFRVWWQSLGILFYRLYLGLKHETFEGPITITQFIITNILVMLLPFFRALTFLKKNVIHVRSREKYVFLGFQTRAFHYTHTKTYQKVHWTHINPKGSSLLICSHYQYWLQCHVTFWHFSVKIVSVHWTGHTGELNHYELGRGFDLKITLNGQLYHDPSTTKWLI